MDTVKYIVDEKGNKSSVVVPVKRWRKINSEYKKLLKKFEIFHGIQDGFAEIKRAKKSGTKLQSLNDLLNEISS